MREFNCRYEGGHSLKRLNESRPQEEREGGQKGGKGWVKEGGPGDGGVWSRRRNQRS